MVPEHFGPVMRQPLGPHPLEQWPLIELLERRLVGQHEELQRLAMDNRKLDAKHIPEGVGRLFCKATTRLARTPPGHSAQTLSSGKGPDLVLLGTISQFLEGVEVNVLACNANPNPDPSLFLNEGNPHIDDENNKSPPPNPLQYPESQEECTVPKKRAKSRPAARRKINCIKARTGKFQMVVRRNIQWSKSSGMKIDL